VLEPINESLRQKMLQGIDERFAEALRTLEATHAEAGDKLDPWIRALIAVMKEMRGKTGTNWMEHLGFDPKGRFALYGLSVWPVMRIEISSATRLRATIERVMTTAGVKLPQRTLAGHAYWVAGGGNFSFVAAVLEREAVAAVVPTGLLDAMLPLVLGTRTPEPNLATAPVVPDLLGRHRFLGILLGYLDARNAIDIVAGARPGPFDAPIRAATGAVSPACRGDLDRLAALVPRFVFGYHRVDEKGFEGSAVLETAPGVVSALRKMHAMVPEVTAPTAGHPLVAFGAALDPRELVNWLKGVTGQLQVHPFTCPWFAKLNEAGTELAGKLATPLPATWFGLRGFSLVLDDATVKPPSFAGHLIVAGERVSDLVTSLAGTVPAIAGIPLNSSGRPIALPVQQFQLPVRSAHLALTTDRLVIAAGGDSARVATETLAVPAPKVSPLMVMAFNMPRAQQLLAAMGQPPVTNVGYIDDVGISLDVVDAGIAFDVWGTWHLTPPPAIAH
jgi:hypothetical protein